jgi:hypothetical protein
MNEKETAVDVFPVFPTPIIIREIPNFYKIKDSFVNDIREYNQEEFEKKENIFNLLKFQKYFPTIHSEIETSLSTIIDDTTRFTPSSVVKPSIKITKPNASIEPSIHSNCDMVGILVVDCPYQFSGDFVFISQHHNDSFHRLLSNQMKNLYFSDSLKISPSDGKLIIFPSTLTYYGEINKTDMDKITIIFEIKLLK